MTDPTLGVGKAAARAPRLEPDPRDDWYEVRDDRGFAVAQFVTRAAAEAYVLDRDDDATVHAAARAPREPLEPKAMAALLAFRRRAHFIGHPEEPMMDGFLKPRVPDWREVIKLVNEALAAARSALPPPEPEERPEDVAQEFADAGAEVHFLTVTGTVPFTRASGDLVSQPPTVSAAIPRVPEPGLESQSYEALTALIQDKPMANGEYVHYVTCSGDRHAPVGGDGCSCPLGRRIKGLRADLKNVVKQRDKLGDDLDQVRAARAGAEAPPHRAGIEAFEKNGIRHGERVVCIDVPRLLGTVIRCATDGVDVRWDDGTLGELVWNDAVAHNAYRLQIVRAGRAGHLEQTVCTEAEFQVQRADEERLTEVFNAGYEAGKRAARAEPPRCAWDEDEDGVWRTDCGHAWTFEDAGAPNDHKARFCFYCGLPITANTYAARVSPPEAPQ